MVEQDISFTPHIPQYQSIIDVKSGTKYNNLPVTSWFKNHNEANTNSIDAIVLAE